MRKWFSVAVVALIVSNIVATDAAAEMMSFNKFFLANRNEEALQTSPAYVAEIAKALNRMPSDSVDEEILASFKGSLNIDGMLRECEIHLVAGGGACAPINLGLLTGLTELSMSSNYLADISFVEKMPNLLNLNMSKNQIMDVAALDKLDRLQYLDLSSNNELADVASLLPMKSLIYVNLKDTKVPDEQIDKLKKRGVYVVDADGMKYNDVDEIPKTAGIMTSATEVMGVYTGMGRGDAVKIAVFTIVICGAAVTGYFLKKRLDRRKG